MTSKTIVVCEQNDKYALALSSALMESIGHAYVVSTFTSVERYKACCEKMNVAMLIISESTIGSDIIDGFSEKTMILKESPDFVYEGAILIDRFQSREEIIKSVFMNLPDCMEEQSVKRLESAKWKVIGLYSPIHRCLQTTFGLSMGQILGRDKKVLYMNFEAFSGFSGWFRREFESDVLDLLYFYDCEPDQLQNRLPLLTHKMGNLDIISPAPSIYDTYDKAGDKWVGLLKIIEQFSDYEYLILDLSEAVQGLLQIMEYCDRIYTLAGTDVISKSKLEQYEKWMVDNSYAGIMSKTERFRFPQFTDIPEHPEMFTQCELAGYVRAIISEDISQLGNGGV